MANEQQNNNLGFFNLSTDGSSAVVRLLHSSVSTIESSNIHWIEESNGKKSQVKCVGDNCPLCLSGNNNINRVYIHLIDYTDGLEKVWVRTDKINEQLRQVENDWGDLSNCVLKITRAGNEFPRYTIMPQNAAMFPPITDKKLVDSKVAYRFYKTRDAKALSTFIMTGTLPEKERTQYVPKSNQQNQFTKPTAPATPSQPAQYANYATPTQQPQYANAPIAHNVNEQYRQPQSDPFMSMPTYNTQPTQPMNMGYAGQPTAVNSYAQPTAQPQYNQNPFGDEFIVAKPHRV